ncbi:MAG: hypothetical protein R3D34_08835 [Nitratireductor sp.]
MSETTADSKPATSGETSRWAHGCIRLGGQLERTGGIVSGGGCRQSVEHGILALGQRDAPAASVAGAGRR